MNEVLKQRLVGALILFALGIIFWPIIFVQPEERSTETMRTIPPRPQFNTAPLSEPSPEGLRGSPAIAARNGEPLDVAPSATVDATATPDSVAKANKAAMNTAPQSSSITTSRVNKPATVAPRTTAPEPLRVDADGVPVAYMLQVASVSTPEKAAQIRGRLQSMKHKAYIKQVPRGDKTLYRVYIGPKFEKAKLEALRSRIDAEFGVSSIVVRYVP